MTQLDSRLKRLAKQRLRQANIRSSLLVQQKKAEAEAELQRNHAAMEQEEAKNVY